MSRMELVTVKNDRGRLGSSSVRVAVALPTDRREDELSGGSAGQRVHVDGVRKTRVDKICGA